MHKAAPLILTALLLALGAAPEAEANDASFGGRGANLHLLKETRIRMSSEEIVLELRDDPRVQASAWHVTATYAFANPTKEAVTLQMGFPETRCHPDEDCNGQGGRFRDLQVTVQGEPVKLEIGQIEEKPAWAPEFGQVHLFEARFKPGQTLKIVHTYTYDRSSSTEGEDVDYLTTTGALWGGPIGQARFVVRVPERPWALSFPPEYTLTSLTEKPTVGGRALTEIVFVARQWTPKRDFQVFFPNFFNAILHNKQVAEACPDALEMANALGDLSDAQSRAALDKSLADKTDAELRICRNLPYARHGYDFKSADLQRIFYPKGPRKGYGFPYIPHEAPGSEDDLVWMTAPFALNPHFSPSLLTDFDQRWVQRIKQEEERRAAPKAP